jgi:hypothetical protein
MTDPTPRSDRAAHAAEAASTGANTVKVLPGGKTFSTITAALDSITDAAKGSEYTLYVGPGTYTETVTMKPWVSIVGNGQGTADDPGPTITGSPQDTQDWAVVSAASNSALVGMQVICSGGKWGDWAVALRAKNCQDFEIASCVLSVDDNGQDGLNLRSAMIDLNSGGSQMTIAGSMLHATGHGQNSTATAVNVWPGGGLQVSESTIVASSPGQSFATIFSRQTKGVLAYSTITGGAWAIYLPDGNATVKAVKCDISGPVSNGVHTDG